MDSQLNLADRPVHSRQGESVSTFKYFICPFFRRFPLFKIELLTILFQPYRNYFARCAPQAVTIDAKAKQQTVSEVKL